MFSFTQLKQIHLEITNRCQASCPMCSRNFHGGLQNPLIKNNDWTLEDFKTIMTEEVLKQLDSFYFCGNFGDPIINDNLIEMCQYAKDINPLINIRIHTNGSARTKEWWELLAKSLPITHSVIFAIDGLEDTHLRYRIGTSYNKIISNAMSFINAGGIAEWAFIKFKHNEHQVDQAKALAKELGFYRFTQKDSSRFVATDKFEVLDKNGDVVDYLEPPSKTTIKPITDNILKNYKQIVDASEIDCYVTHTKEVYIDAYKNVMPCCFLASIPYQQIPKNDIAKNIKEEIKEQYLQLIADLGNTCALEKSVKEIIETQTWQTVWKKYWTINKLITCARTCGIEKISKPKDQFVEVLKL